MVCSSCIVGRSYIKQGMCRGQTEGGRGEEWVHSNRRRAVNARWRGAATHCLCPRKVSALHESALQQPTIDQHISARQFTGLLPPCVAKAVSLPVYPTQPQLTTELLMGTSLRSLKCAMNSTRGSRSMTDTPTSAHSENSSSERSRLTTRAVQGTVA